MLLLFSKGTTTFIHIDCQNEHKMKVTHSIQIPHQTECVTAQQQAQSKTLIVVSVFPTPIQFVPFRDYIDRSGNQVLSMARLAKDVLAEIPDQLLSFMKSRGIEPRPPLPASSDSPSMSTTTTTTTSTKPGPKERNMHA